MPEVETLNVALAIIQTEFKSLREVELKSIAMEISTLKADLRSCDERHQEAHRYFHAEINSLQGSRSMLKGVLAALAAVWTLVSAWIISKM